LTDPFSTMLDVIYRQLGVTATIEDVAAAVTVVDKTAGVELEPNSGNVRVPTIVPAACVRRSELTARGVTNVGTLVGKNITFNSATWTIVSHKPKPNPQGGESLGEVYLFLRES
jgi:hypothetical protein